MSVCVRALKIELLREREREKPMGYYEKSSNKLSSLLLISVRSEELQEKYPKGDHFAMAESEQSRES